MSNNLAYLALGAAIVGIIVLAVSYLQPQVVPICQDPPVGYHTVKIFFDQSIDPPKLIVKPEKAGPAEQCDVVSFVNLTGQDVTIDFGGAAGDMGNPFNDVEKFVIKPENDEEGFTRSPQVNLETPEVVVIYPYLVTAGEIGTEQSPVIRIGPRKPLGSE